MRKNRVYYKWLKQFERYILQYSFRTVKKLVILITGGFVLLVGIAMLVLPGPAILVIPLGLAILALEFKWAQRILKEAKKLVKSETTNSPHFLSRVKNLLKRLSTNLYKNLLR